MKQLLVVSHKRRDMEGIIIALISLISTIVLGLLQFRKDKAEAKKVEAEGLSNLVEVALKVSKHETDILRELNETLSIKIKELDAEIVHLKEEIIKCRGGHNE